jgi:hypothetical protein
MGKRKRQHMERVIAGTETPIRHDHREVVSIETVHKALEQITGVKGNIIVVGKEEHGNTKL